MSETRKIVKRIELTGDELKIVDLERILRYKYGIHSHRFITNLSKEEYIEKLEKMIKEQDERVSLMSEERKKREQDAMKYLQASRLGDINNFIDANGDGGNEDYWLKQVESHEAFEQVMKFRKYLESLLRDIPFDSSLESSELIEEAKKAAQEAYLIEKEDGKLKIT